MDPSNPYDTFSYQWEICHVWEAIQRNKHESWGVASWGWILGKAGQKCRYVFSGWCSCLMGCLNSLYNSSIRVGVPLVYSLINIFSLKMSYSWKLLTGKNKSSIAYTINWVWHARVLFLKGINTVLHSPLKELNPQPLGCRRDVLPTDRMSETLGNSGIWLCDICYHLSLGLSHTLVEIWLVFLIFYLLSLYILVLV